MLVSATLAAALIGAHPHANAACDAAALFRGVRAHTGGARWDAAKELVADGTVVSEGLPGRTRIATDLGSGATSTADDQDIVKTRLVISASATWKQDLTGGVHPLDAPGARAAARTSAYLARNGYFRPATDPASFACLPDVTEDDRTLRRVRITPRGGRPAAVWVDPAAHVVVRTQEQAPTYLSTTHYGAYRQDAGLLLPHEIVETSGSTENTVVRMIRAYRVQRTVTAADFMRPPDSANQRIRTGATSTEVPIEPGRGLTVVNAFVNGHGPLPFILDTGGHAILTTDAARELGVTARGGGVSGGGGEGSITEQYARVQCLRIGDAEITDFPMFVIPFGKGLTDRGPGKTPMAGILGLEIFERYAVTLDFAHHVLRLQTPRSFTPRSDDVAVPLMFQDDMPLAYAAADGARGLFGIDSGNSGTTLLFGDYLRHHGFFRRYEQGAEQQSSGAGGLVRQTAFRLRELELGGLAMHNFVTGFVVQQKGSFSSRTEAGNIGYDVLSQFTLTTDYRRGRMYLHRNPNAPLPPYTRTGLAGFSRDAENHLVVGTVLPSSPASEAGLTKGDVILAVEGTPTDKLSYAELAAKIPPALGAPIRLTVKTKDGQRDVTLILRELLCNPGANPCGPWVSPAR